MCLEGIGIVNPSSDKQFEDYIEELRIENNLGARTSVATRLSEINLMGAKYELLNEDIIKNFEEFKKKLQPNLEAGSMITFSMGNHILRLVQINNEGIIVDDPYGCLSCKKDLLTRQSKLANTYCNNKDGHASCCEGTKAYVYPCKTNSLNDMSNTPGKHCFWSKESINELRIYNIIIVKP